jgi:hypothetical protein
MPVAVRVSPYDESFYDAATKGSAARRTGSARGEDLFG